VRRTSKKNDADIVFLWLFPVLSPTLLPFPWPLPSPPRVPPRDEGVTAMISIKYRYMKISPSSKLEPFLEEWSDFLPLGGKTYISSLSIPQSWEPYLRSVHIEILSSTVSPPPFTHSLPVVTHMSTFPMSRRRKIWLMPQAEFLNSSQCSMCVICLFVYFFTTPNLYGSYQHLLAILYCTAGQRILNKTSTKTLPVFYTVFMGQPLQDFYKDFHVFYTVFMGQLSSDSTSDEMK